MKFIPLALLFTWLCVVAATNSGDALFRGCAAWVGKYTFECPSKYAKIKGKRVSGCNCWSPEYLATYVDCATRAKGANTQRALDSLLGACGTKTIRPTLTLDEINQIYDNATDYFVDVKTVKNKTETSYSPIRFTQAQVDQAQRSFASGFYAKYTGQLYGGLMLAYMGAILLAAAISNFLKKVAPGFVHKSTNNRVALFFRQKLINPAIFGYKHSIPVKWGPFNMSLPTRAQAWVLIGYFVMYIIFMFIKYDIYDGNTRFTTRPLQISRYVADRSGIIATSQLPLLYALAGRNNIMLWITGLSYDTMNLYHRWVSRIMYLNVFIHAAAFSVNFKKQNKYNDEFSETFMIWGLVSCVCGGFLMFFSLRHFREKLYEFFLLCHWAFVVFFTIGVWYHCKPHGYMEWVYAAIAIWAFDRASRLARLVFNGLNAKAHLELHPQHLIKIKVDYTSFLKPHPGAYAFIHFLNPIWRCWENHPFTAYPSPIPGEEKKLVFCVRVRDGKTKQIAQYLAKNNNAKTVPVFLDGLYGHTFPLHTSESIVIITGGIGFTGGYSYACRLTNQSEKKNITFIWAIQNHENVETFKDELEYLAKNDVSVFIYLSNEPENAQPKVTVEKHFSDSENGNEKDLSSGSTISFNTMFTRPDLKVIIESAINEAPGSIGFLVCGPASMNDDVRQHVSKNMDKGKGRVDLYLEAFNW
ncbi:uncharacterized protein SAPINGB_P004718 [Magnusiomyces paraingens]|uniref:FAD-binding FR-type domain-containing protein n=1 Tax=Magnusiomyces paraingens TaxID=2606893 RepID=A0A5E8BVQ5_9ASCO|nr:uncharacterized protein SAPINGB_P004718 [Saprochaete ingens]VVT55748.1 unnamed protein product [Saprochaete ingens]